MVGAGVTEMLAALLGEPAPVSLALIGPVMFVNVAITAPVTFTCKVQVPPPGKPPPLRLIELGLTIGVPPQVLLSTPAAIKPEGSGSVKATPVSGRVMFGLLIVKVSGVLLPK